jgi:hypothetical protein
MSYYHNINKSLKKLVESNSFTVHKKLNEDEKENLLEPLDWYSELLGRMFENIKDDWFDAMLINNVIYVLESDFDVNIGNDETQNIGLGVFAIYEFKGNKVISHVTKLETIEDTHEIGIKPLSYFIKPGENDVYDSIGDFIDWYDDYYGRKTFMLDPEFNAYFESIRNELKTLKENMLDTRVNFVIKSDKYVLTKEFKEDIISMLSSSEDLSKHFYAFNPDFDDFKVNNLKSKLDKEWSIRYTKLDDRDEYLLNRQEGYDFSYSLYVDSILEDYVTSEFVYNIMGAPLNESKEDDIDLEPLDVSLIKRGDDYVATPGFKGYLISILDDDTPGNLNEFRKISKYFLNMDSYIDDDIDFYADNISKEWVFKFSKDTPKDETDYLYGLWIGNQWIDWVNEEFLKQFVSTTLKEEDEKDLESLSVEDVKKQLEDEEITYEDLGDELFTTYSSLLPTNVSNLLEILTSYFSFPSTDLSPAGLEYIKNLILNQYDEYVSKNGSLEYRMDSSDLVFPRDKRMDVSEDFLKACFDDELFSFFDYNTSDVNLDDLNTQLDEKSLLQLSKLGITEEFIKDVIDNKVDEDDPYAPYENIVESELRHAAADAYRAGAEKDAMDSFMYSFNRAMPNGVTYAWGNDNQGRFVMVNISKDFIESNLKEVLYAFEYHSSFVNRALVAAFEQEFKDNFQIREPRYGFGGFDKEVFNDTLINEGIPEIEDAIEKGQK